MLLCEHYGTSLLIFSITLGLTSAYLNRRAGCKRNWKALKQATSHKSAIHVPLYTCKERIAYDFNVYTSHDGSQNSYKVHITSYIFLS